MAQNVYQIGPYLSDAGVTSFEQKNYFNFFSRHLTTSSHDILLKFREKLAVLCRKLACFIIINYLSISLLQYSLQENTFIQKSLVRLTPG